MNKIIFTKERFVNPEKKCVVLVRSTVHSGYVYAAYSIEEITFIGRDYWGVIDSDGDEWGDINDFAPREWAILEIA